MPESAPDPLQLKMSLIYLIPTPTIPKFGLDEAERMLSTALTTLSSVKIQPVDCERLDSFTHRSLQGD